MDTNQPRWQRRKDARPAEIIEAALTLFVDKGFAATRLDDVATQAGVTKGTVYLYFANKEELFKAVVRETILPNIESGEHLLADHQGTWAELLWILLERWADRMEYSASTGISKLMIAEASNFPDLARFYVEEVVMRSRKLFATVIQRGIDAGEFRPVDPVMATRAVISPLMLIKVWKQSFSLCDTEPVDLKAFARFHYELMMQGLASR
ncbi:TetR/AcrR family transcriptional regulator [Chitinimonas sp. BJB300]|uniref:TetR/AcrR family transcriptional regulator n=1 Tax=Chitinimonas sp. BJB300 TaxID=1559339 RepID=UPI000C10251F|nr:TetR/AcrR family transcriptional regulator [Chitinimonas sp. BJB300]PHV13015.1 TetR family transcriptional regulator [Chitinimonas sp. BJB300]TSJ88928.1 TetR/AcrR family transcriptional regulator [Chitinimonas sp. BJB300]